MIISHALAYLPILAAPAVATGLVVGLQHLLKLPRTPRITSAATDLVVVNPDTAAPHVTWEDVSTHWNPFVTSVLPIATSVAIVGLGLWPFAYLGWLIIEIDPDPGWAQQVPPWFGNAGYFIGFGFTGLVIAILGALVLCGIGIGLHALGKCLLWPEVCTACDPPQRTTDNDETCNNEGNDHGN